jgi:hypothetical protein
MTAARIKDLTLQDVHTQFSLARTSDAQFFPEWQIDLPTVSPVEQQRLAEIQQDYLYQSEDVMHESAVKMVVLSPLFSLAGFYRPPFRIAAEKTIRIQATDRGKVYRGVIDVLVLHQQLWALVVESKRNTFSLEVARPQVLTYMLANPVSDRPTFGLITNGLNFRLLKLLGRQYGESDEFYLGNQQDMERLLQILRHLGQLVAVGESGRSQAQQ